MESHTSEESVATFTLIWFKIGTKPSGNPIVVDNFLQTNRQQSINQHQIFTRLDQKTITMFAITIKYY